MSDLIGTLRAIVRDELSRIRLPQLATVTQVLARDGDDSKNNHEVNVKLLASGLELQRVPVTVDRLGLSALPNEGDLLMVAFADGDLNAPVAIGCLYDDTSHPPKAQLHEVVYQPPDDEDSSVRRLHLELQNGSTLTLHDDKLEIVFGDTSVVVNKDGDVTLQAKGKIAFTSQSDLELSAQGDIKLTAQGQLALKGMSATLEGQTEAKLKGAQVGLAGITQFSPS